MKTLVPYIWAAGILQWIIASANIFLPRKLRYAQNIASMSMIVRQVFIVHAVYIGVLLIALGALCLGFAPDLAGGSALGRSISAFLAAFWGARIAIQLFYYDPELKRQNWTAHLGFLGAFVYLGSIFTLAALV